MMRLVTPGVLWMAGIACVAILLLHLLSWRRPRPRPLPTARFLPPAAQPSRFRRIELSDVAVLLLRLGAISSLGVAVAGPAVTWRRAGLARVIVVDRSRAVGSATDVADSVRALTTGLAETRLVAFDSTATVSTPDEWLASPRTTAARGEPGAGLVAGIREAVDLSRRFARVEIVLISPMVAEEASPALLEIARASTTPVRFVRVAPASATSPPAREGAALPPPEDAIGAAAWSAWGVVPGHLRLVRGAATSRDSVFARSGGTLVVWPIVAGAGGETEALTAGDVAVVGPWTRGATVAAGTTMARWNDGADAATQRPLGIGCIREVGVGVPDRGDATLRPAFLHLVRSITVPCVSPDLRPLTAGELSWLSSGVSTGTPAFTGADAANVWLQRLLLGLTVLLLGVEWWLRDRRPSSAAAAGRASTVERRVA
ncbi:MAG: BatA domain-containing protein [Gemmatimonadaceae bacterium]